VEDRAHEGRKHRLPNIVDEYSHERLTIRIVRRLKAVDVIEALGSIINTAESSLWWAQASRCMAADQFHVDWRRGWLGAVATRHS
jgi:hypothetical protein